jgi:hypothetical protein
MGQFESIRFLSGRPLLRELSADRLNTILQEIKRNKPKGERGITVRQDGTGTYIGLAASLPRGGGTPTASHPFKIASVQDPDNEDQYLVTVQPGTINSLLPTNLLDGENLEEFVLPEDTLRYVTLSCTAADNALTSCELSLESSPPAAQTPLAFALPATYEVLLGVVYNSTVRQVVNTNLTVSGRQAYITDKTNPVPGSLPYNVFLVWG